MPLRNNPKLAPHLHTYTDLAIDVERGIVTPIGGDLPLPYDLFRHVEEFIDSGITTPVDLAIKTVGAGTFGSVYSFTPDDPKNPPFCVKIFKVEQEEDVIEEIRTSLSNAKAYLADYAATILSDVVTYQNKTFYILELVESLGPSLYEDGDFVRLLAILERMEKNKLTFVDWKPKNMGRNKKGELVLIDLDAIYPHTTDEYHYSMDANLYGSYLQVPKKRILYRDFITITEPPESAEDQHAKWAEAAENLLVDHNQMSTYSTVAALALTMVTMITKKYANIQARAIYSNQFIEQQTRTEEVWKPWPANPHETGTDHIVRILEDTQSQVKLSGPENVVFQSIIARLKAAPTDMPRIAHLLSRF
jgi:hypothetical protein